MPAHCGRQRSTMRSATPSVWTGSRATVSPRACGAISSGSSTSPAGFCRSATQFAASIPYGQGMSVAALEACLLRRLLERLGEDSNPIAGLAPTFFAEVQTLIETPWSVATLDFVFPDTRGQRPADFEITLKFGIALTRLAAEDPDVHKLTAEVQNLLKPRSVYRDPALVQRVLAKMAEA